MALGGCAACLKYLMIIWNFIILLLGIAILGVGVWMVVDKNSGKFVEESLPDDSPFVINYSRVSDANLFETLAYVLIVFGGIVIIISFLGYLGAMRESQCMLGTAFVLLFLIFGALVGLGVYLYIEKDDIDVEESKLRPLISKMVTDAVENYGKDDTSKEFMERIQTRHRCCGAENGGQDYAAQNLVQAACAKEHYATPCVPLYYQYVKEHIGVKQFFSGKFTIAMAVTLGVAGALILAMVLTLILCCSIRRSGSY